MFSGVPYDKFLVQNDTDFNKIYSLVNTSGYIMTAEIGDYNITVMHNVGLFSNSQYSLLGAYNVTDSSGVH